MNFDAIECGFFEDYECDEFEFMGLPAKIVKGVRKCFIVMQNGFG